MSVAYDDLLVWQRGVALAKAIYASTEQFPKSEIFGLTSQMRRAAVSIPSNIAEGHQRRNHKEFRQFLHIALGSGAELDTQICIAKSVVPNFNDADTLRSELSEIRKMVSSLARKLTTDN